MPPSRRHGLESDRQVIGFVSLMFEVAPNFDREPVLAALLANRAVPPAERWRRLFAPEPAVEAAWARAAEPGFRDASAWWDGGV
jgi:hypothetical protein